jgi:translation elongation factor EF-1alpha
MGETEIGRVTHYFSKIGVAALEITAGELKVGDTIHIKGHTSDFTTTIESIQIEHEQVQVAKVGDNIGIKVPDHAREHDQVFVVTPE